MLSAAGFQPKSGFRNKNGFSKDDKQLQAFQENEKLDSAWRLGPLNLNLELGGGELLTFLCQPRDETYIPYGPVGPLDCIPKTAIGMSKALSGKLLSRDLGHLFHQTKIGQAMKNVIGDFVKAKSGQLVRPHSFEFKDIDLLVKKGGMEKECKEVYEEMGFPAKEIFPRAVRDYYTSVYIYLHLRGFPLSDLSICGSTLCVTTMVDYCGAADDSKTGLTEAYEAAMAEGVYRFAKQGHTLLLQELAVSSAFILLKDDYRNEAILGAGNDLRLDSRRGPSYLPISPASFMEMRWWDGAVAPFYKSPLALGDGAGLQIDNEYAPIGSSMCTNFRKCMDNLVRYNEIVDVIHDTNSLEPLNEIHVAGRYGGLAAVEGYAEMCATVVDDISNCQCSIGDQAHEYAQDIAVGSCNWYIIMPRYRAFSLLAEVWDVTEDKYRKILGDSNHGAWTTSQMAVTFKNDGMIHDDNWNPLWRMDTIPSYKKGPCDHCIKITEFILQRCVYREDQDKKKSDIETLVSSHLHLSDDTGMVEFWTNIFDTVSHDVTATDPGIKDDFLEAFMMVWELLKGIENKEIDAFGAANAQWAVNIAIDKVLIASFKEKEGHILRRLLMGSLSCIFERTHFSVYGRVLTAAIKNAE